MEKNYYTYIIKSSQFYKIGRTTNLKERLRKYKTNNPCYKLIYVCEGDYEKRFMNILIGLDAKHNSTGAREWYSVPRNIRTILNKNPELLFTN